MKLLDVDFLYSSNILDEDIFNNYLILKDKFNMA
jgi:hypothetical protein